jgi:hypothetical protein
MKIKKIKILGHLKEHQNLCIARSQNFDPSTVLCHSIAFEMQQKSSYTFSNTSTFANKPF